MILRLQYCERVRRGEHVGNLELSGTGKEILTSETPYVQRPYAFAKANRPRGHAASSLSQCQATNDSVIQLISRLRRKHSSIAINGKLQTLFYCQHETVAILSCSSPAQLPNVTKQS